jgi:hypothetical protein
VNLYYRSQNLQYTSSRMEGKFLQWAKCHIFILTLLSEECLDSLGNIEKLMLFWTCECIAQFIQFYIPPDTLITCKSPCQSIERPLHKKISFCLEACSLGGFFWSETADGHVTKSFSAVISYLDSQKHAGVSIRWENSLNIQDSCHIKFLLTPLSF